MLKETKPINGKVDLIVPKEFQREFGMKLGEANINFVIKIDNLQDVINNAGNTNTKTSPFSNTKSGRNHIQTYEF